MNPIPHQERLIIAQTEDLNKHREEANLNIKMTKKTY